MRRCVGGILCLLHARCEFLVCHVPTTCFLNFSPDSVSRVVLCIFQRSSPTSSYLIFYSSSRTDILVAIVSPLRLNARMPTKVDWKGVFPAVPTQFHDDFSLDLPATQKHVEALLAEGIHGLVMLGTIGENCSLSMDEKIAVLKATVEVAGGKVPVLTGVAEFTTANACATAQAAQDAGVDGLMVMPGMVYNSDGRETVNHFRTVAGSMDLPIMCYNNPPVYRVDITPEMFQDMA